jgi:hypothetical protein
MAGISEAASVIAVSQISEQILSLCWKYYSGVKDAQKDMERLCGEVKALSDALMKVQELLKGPKEARLPASNTLAERIKQCVSELEGLRSRLDPGKGQKTMRRLGLRALKWPFTSEGVDKTITVLNRHKATFHLALNIDQT